MIGIYDYGIGGLGVYRLLKAMGFEQAVMYFSDAGYKPYGQVPEKELSERVRQAIDFFHGQGVRKIAVACNAASSVLPKTVKDKNILSIIDFAIEVVKLSKVKNLAVWGGGRTVESNIFPVALQPLGIEVSQYNTQFFSLQIEKGDISSPELRQFAKETLEKSEKVEAVLLACTHYPALLPVFRSLNPSLQYLDPAAGMARYIFDHWQGNGRKLEDRFYTTGDEITMKAAAKSAFDVAITEVQRVTL